MFIFFMQRIELAGQCGSLDFMTFLLHVLHFFMPLFDNQMVVLCLQTELLLVFNFSNLLQTEQLKTLLLFC